MKRAVVVTVSDRSSRGEREDESGPALRAALEEMGIEVVASRLVPDERDEITAALLELADREGVDLVVTTGGTGPAPRDVTPEATRAVIEREMPGLAELMRLEGLKHTPFAVLSRAIVGIRGQTLIVNVPGSPRAVMESLEALRPVLPATLALIRGEDSPCGVCDPPSSPSNAP